MNKSDQRIRKFNPGTLQSDEEVIEQFVVRKRELDIVLEVLRGNIDSPSCQHVLVVAPRGRGKTMLLARVAAELNPRVPVDLKIDDKLSECLLPVRFMEESHEVLNIADFWLETLFHLARESARHDPVLAQELRETHADLTDRWRERELADRVLAAVLDAADRLGKKLVLMVENLQDLCKNVDADFGWQLRSALQSEPQIMLLATTTSRFKGLDDAEEPFFEQFRSLDLEPLTTEDCRRLWQIVSGDAVTGREIRPLEILTGGSPRLLVMVAQFANHRSLSQLMEELVTLIDDHTEYFRSHLEVLASVERRVYLAVIDLWQPSNAGEIATRARKDIRTVSTLLRRLANRGAVIVEGTGRKRMYVAAERLYSIYYKLRRERDEAAVVANLIYFMAVFYSKAELAEMSDRLIAEAARLPVIREGFERAIAEQPQVGSVFSNIVRPSIDQTSDLATSIENESVERLFEEITTALTEGAFEKVIETVGQAFTARSANWSRVPEPLIALAFLHKALAHEQLSDYAAAVESYDEVIARFGDSDAPDLQERVAWALLKKGNTQVQLGDYAAAVESYDEMLARFGDSDAPDLQVPVSWALLDKGDTYEQLDQFAAAISAYDELIKRFGDSDLPDLQVRVAWTLSKKGDVQGRLGEFAAALATYDEVIARFGDSDTLLLQVRVAWALLKKGNTQVQLGDYAAAVESYDEVIVRFGDSDLPDLQILVALALYDKGDIQIQLDKLTSAVACYDEVIVRFGDSDLPDLQERAAWALCGKGNTQVQLGDFAAAAACYDEVIARFGDSEVPTFQDRVAWALSGKGDVQRQLGELEAAVVFYDEVIARFGDSDAIDLQEQVAWALLDKGDTHEQLNQFTAAISAYDELIKRFSDGDVPNLQEHVAWALCKKGDVQSRLGELAAAVACYDEVIACFGDSDAPALQERVAWTLCAKGDVQGQLGELAAALSAYDEVITHFGDSEAFALQVPVARALCGKGNMQVQLGELAAAVACYDEVIARLGNSDVIDLQERVAWVLCKKGDVQSRLGELAAAIACYDEVIARFGDSVALMLQERVVWALSGKGDVQGRLGEFVAAISAYDEAVARLGDSDAPDHQAPITETLFKKGIRQINMGRAKEALHTCEEIEKRLGALTGNEKIKFTWRANCMRVMVLMVQKKRRAAVDAFRSAYAVFVPDNETVMHEMLNFVPELIANGASERDLVAILSSDREKADVLVPLIVALLQRAGEVVRAPVEVLEVAKDINKDIERRMAG